ncbi:MAG TPA: hypothetical protein DEO32_00305 [Ruminococcaceae bacterium]|nr:hypothetical protein [Oscillospiraceae bacterium]
MRSIVESLNSGFGSTVFIIQYKTEQNNKIIKTFLNNEKIMNLSPETSTKNRARCGNFSQRRK